MDNLVEGYGAGQITYSSGKIGNALALDGVSEWVLVENANLNPQTQATFAAWVNIDATGTYHPVIGQRGTLSSWGRGISITPEGKPYVYSRDTSGNWKSIVSTTAIAPGTWNHLAMVQDGQYLYGYLNGQLFGTLDMGSHSSMKAYFTLGSFPLSTSYYFDGRMDEVRIFSTAMTPVQVNNLYNRFLLNAKYDLGNQDDSSGWNTPLTEYGSPTYESNGLVGSYVHSEMLKTAMFGQT